MDNKNYYELYCITIFNIFLFCIKDKAGLKWGGFNAPIGTVDDEELTGTDDKERRKTTKMQRGWSGKTWPGRELGPPLTADGGTLGLVMI